MEAKVKGGETRPRLKLAADLSSVFKVWEEILVGEINACGSNRKLPFERTET